MKYILISILLVIIIIYTITDRLYYLFNNNNNDNNEIIAYNDDKKDKDDNKIIKYYQFEDFDNIEKTKEEIFLIKYSSIRNKLDTDEDYSNLNEYINEISDSIYINVIDNVIYDEEQLLEIIINDIEKTKLKYNIKKLKNIFIIKKTNNDITKLILFYDGLIYNERKFKFIKNNFMGNTIVYKLDINNTIISHHLQ
jgi:hypothetical protein